MQKNHGGKWTLGYSLLLSSMAYAEPSVDEWLQGVHVSGNIRAYSFSRNYNSQMTDLRSTSLGGKIKAEMQNRDGFGGALGVYIAQDVGLNNHAQNNKYINPLLMGTNYGIYTLGEAYLQYQQAGWLVRIGNQTIDNPWINPADGFMIPNFYQAGIVSFQPAEGVQIEGERILAFKNRTASGFSNSNLFALPYDNPHYTGSDNGAAVLGASYKGDSGHAKTWLYRFNDFAKMAYLQGGYKWQGSDFSPYADFQYMRETGDGAQLLGVVDSKAYGVKTGIAFPKKLGSAYFAYNRVPANPLAGVSNGNLLSPYTQVYNTDPLYTTVMNYGLVSSRGAGHAWKIGSNIKLFDQKLDAELSYSRYYTLPYVANVDAYMLDIAYRPDGLFSGLIIRDRLGIEHGNPNWGGAYLDNRIMLQYGF